ncbi:MAG: hypothetical protein RQ736_05870 [Thiogranum sp.]|nr:hypothetical protein [Thiogranum sp.]
MRLSVPDRTIPRKGSFDSTPHQVKQWIDHLPMANIGATARLLFTALTELNHQDVPAQQRFKALELLRKPVAFASENMTRHFVGKPLPLAEKNLKIARLSRELIRVLATGYKILVMEQIAGVARDDKKLLVTCMQRAIKLQGQVLLKACQVYEPYPETVWLEIHSLYRHAESNRLHTLKVTDEFASSEALSTIADNYKQILLLALACPYRLRHGEAAIVYDLLEKWAPYAKLGLVGENGTGLFCTNLDTDQPPTYLVLRDANENRSTCRVLNTAQLAEQVRAALSASRNSDNSISGAGKISTSALKHMMLTWGIMPKRRYSRTAEHSQIIVATGLSAVHYFVSGEFAFSEKRNHTFTDTSSQDGPRLQDRAHFQARETGGRTPDVWDINTLIPAAAESENAEITGSTSGLQIDTNHRTHSWKMINVSAGGYCLLWDNAETTRSQVGELLGIREQSDPDTFHWRLGVTRWLKFAEKEGLQLGVQMLSPGAVAVAAQLDGRQKTDEDYVRGLLLPEVASIQQKATMLLSSPPFRTGDNVRVNCHGKDIRIKLTKLVENTGSFAQFQFCSLGEIPQKKSLKEAKSFKSSDFDDVWELI